MSSERDKENGDLADLDRRNYRAMVVLSIMVAGVLGVVFMNMDSGDEVSPEQLPTGPLVGDVPGSTLPSARLSRQVRAFGQRGSTNIFDPERRLLFCWDEIPSGVLRSTVDTGPQSNIRRQDYAGAKACAECHRANFESWSDHPHRWMNALATPASVLGDFSGGQRIEYQGGVGKFLKEGDEYRMVLEKDGKQWVYRIRRTIGSRYFQYYIGILLSGTVPDDAPRRTEDHVLPFGYWMKEKQWVPTVHVFRKEDADHEEEDPYNALRFLFYDRNCAVCHTTPPIGEWVLKMPGASRITEYGPRSGYVHLAGVIHESDPSLFMRGDAFHEYTDPEMREIIGNHQDYRPNELGVACEACHHGCKEHESKSSREASESLPPFSAISPNIRWTGTGNSEIRDRTPANVNLICARCHSGVRPTYANGAHTWNSTEYADAVRGACYDSSKARAAQMEQLTCVTCHNPHKATGYEWPLTEKQNDQKCLECHEQFKPQDKLMAHTRHGADSAGSRCMNCHNPRINEGLEKMVHTHRIFNPTDRGMIEANHPNACNLCHLEKPIDWTISHLRDWFGEEHIYAEEKLAANYPNRAGPVGAGWLKSPHRGTRLAASSAVTRAKASWAYLLLVDLLETDDTLVNRQFTQRNMRDQLGINLGSKGYEFHMSPPERKQALESVRNEVSGMLRKLEAAAK